MVDRPSLITVVIGFMIEVPSHKNMFTFFVQLWGLVRIIILFFKIFKVHGSYFLNILKYVL